MLYTILIFQQVRECSLLQLSMAGATQSLASNEICIIQKSKCCFSKSWIVLSVLLSFTLLWTVIAELLLLIEIYSVNDIKFFTLSCIFLFIPLSLISLIVLEEFGIKGHIMAESLVTKFECTWWKYLFYIPVFNISLALASKSYLNEFDGVESATLIHLTSFETFLNGTMTFPLYIINLSYLCENISSYRDISIFNIISLLMAVINFIKVPPMSLLHFAKFARIQDHYHKGTLNEKRSNEFKLNAMDQAVLDR